MHTENYTNLKHRLDKLKRVYLPRTFSATGSYKDPTYEKVRAYKVLAHAEMEYYFEQTALSIARLAYEKWNAEKKASTPIIALVAYHTGQFSQIPEQHDGNHSEEDISFRIHTSYSQYNSLIRDKNNGIKEKNILNIFLPIGVQSNEIDVDMLTALNNFGSERGMIAHSTRSSNITTPEDALNSVNDLMSYIGTFDEFLFNYKAKI